MAQFVEPPRKGEVMGNAVVAKPVPFSRLRAVQMAGADGDSVAVVDAMCDIVRDYVTLEGGDAIDTSALSTAAIQKLYLFATDVGGGSVADFTPSS